jgi:hypothetical protein
MAIPKAGFLKNEVKQGRYGPNGIIWWFAELVRALLPRIIQSGLATVEHVDIDSLETRLQEEAAAMRLTAFSLRWVVGQATLTALTLASAAIFVQHLALGINGPPQDHPLGTNSHDHGPMQQQQPDCLEMLLDPRDPWSIT